MLSEDPPIYLQMQKPHQHWYSDRKWLREISLVIISL